LSGCIPGKTIPILVTGRGIAIHPRHSELIEKLKEETNLEILDIKELKKIADDLTHLTVNPLASAMGSVKGIPEPTTSSGEIVAISKYPDGTILDVI